jgi:uncharacterized membrane protein
MNQTMKKTNLAILFFGWILVLISLYVPSEYFYDLHNSDPNYLRNIIIGMFFLLGPPVTFGYFLHRTNFSLNSFKGGVIGVLLMFLIIVVMAKIIAIRG